LLLFKINIPWEKGISYYSIVVTFFFIPSLFRSISHFLIFFIASEAVYIFSAIQLFPIDRTRLHRRSPKAISPQRAASISRGTKSSRKSWFESTRPVKFIRFKYLWGGRAGRTGPRSIWRRREKTTSILYSRGERCGGGGGVAASFSERKVFQPRITRRRRPTSKTNGEFNWPDCSTNWKSCQASRKTTGCARIYCIMRAADFTFRSRIVYSPFLAFPQRPIFVPFTLRGLS